MALKQHSQPDLAKLSTLGLGGTAEIELTAGSEQDLDELCEFIMHTQLRPFMLGRGSNLLCPDGHHDYALIRVQSPASPDRVEQDGKRLVLRAGAGQSLPGLLSWAQKAGLSGLENLTGIPGSVGGAVAMNAGSYGTEMKDVVTRIRLWTPAQGLFWKDASECRWGYRHFDPDITLGKCMIWEVEMALTETTTDAVKKRMKAIYAKKKETQPVAARSAGCIFKNPEGQSAGLLLDKAGLRGKTLGGVGFSELHANFLVNHGTGTSGQAVELIRQAREAVREQFDVNLETEVIFL